MKVFRLFAIILLIFPSLLFSLRTQASEEEGIRNAVLDYIEGWYHGDADRMARALHPDFVKRRMLNTNRVDHLDAKAMVNLTANGNGKQIPIDKQRKEITILDIYENMATVKLVSAEYVDYLHLSKIDGRWVIINVLWDFQY